MSNQEASFYENDLINTTEKAILAEDLIFKELVNTKAKFYIPALTPSVDPTAKVATSRYGSYQQSNYIELTIPAYFLLMFMEPTIEKIEHDEADGLKHLGTSTNAKYFLAFPNTKFKIPKGTTFAVTFIGGSLRLDQIVLVGVHSTVDTK